MPKQKTTLHEFLEQPKTPFAIFIQGVIVVLILLSALLVGIEIYLPELFAKHRETLMRIEYGILAVFTIEYLLRITSATKKLRFAFKPMSLVDFFAIAPTYVEILLPFIINTAGFPLAQVARLLRLSRVLRLLKLFRFGKQIKGVFKWQGTILQSIAPVIFFLSLVKGGVWFLEYLNIWFYEPNLGELFAIIGFALGIILSQKIASSYDKFLKVEEIIIRLSGTLSSLKTILNSKHAGLGTQACSEWSQAFYYILTHKNVNNHDIDDANATLYKAIEKVEKKPAELAVLHANIAQDAIFSLAKKDRITPKAYDTLLHQATIIYLFLIALFIPGASGLVSIIVAGYILYGMYHLTQDLDSILGGDYNLTNIDITEFKHITK